MARDYMTKDYRVYVNGVYFDTLWNSTILGDRPESNKAHEKSLWTIFQLKKLNHEIVITDKEDHVELKATKLNELMSWFKLKYPEFIDQLDKSIFTKHPHPNDLLKNS
ncbi:MAG: hypothetical protein JNJ75_13210 [Cyclobacteriaceae bacterium]|nr:hypothetical protein [Cyclobacteriaceae bacterium]